MRKKILLLISSFIILLALPLSLKASTNKTTTEIKLHYHRFAEDYNNEWDLYLWNPTSKAPGFAVDFEKDENEEIIKDDFGVVFTIDLVNTNLTKTSKVGFIMRRGGNSWAEKDVAKDRFITVAPTSKDGIQHIYIVQGTEKVGYSREEMDISDKILMAYFANENKVLFTATKNLAGSKIRLTANDETVSAQASMTNLNGTVILKDKIDLTKTYKLLADYGEGEKSCFVTFDGIYDSASFEQTFGYDGELGAIIKDNKTIFRLWAPISNSVSLNIYNSGTPSFIKGGSDELYKQVDMQKGEKGTWEYTIDSNLHGKYYTFTVTNGNSKNEVVDPYAKSTGVNGLRGMIVDFSKTNTVLKRAQNITNATDAIIYETHVRDFTIDKSWKGNREYAGKFMGFTVSGTTYTNNNHTVKTGLDHLVELGITHVQLLPIFDFGVIDETNCANTFNWGYMPLNFNTLEGSYATDPYDGVVRINEFKSLVNSLHKNNINVIMDVVYNHTGLSADSNFNLILPGYYHRLVNGQFSNGSGTGNETASERIMMRKFIVDSTKFFAKEYNLSGFRFDLMALHDVETMKQVEKELRKIDPNILVYGEPWTGGQSALNPSLAADKLNLDQISSVGAFNDDLRDAIKGSVFDAKGRGFVQGFTDAATYNKLKYGIVGGIDYPNLDKSSLSYKKAWGTEPTKTINYVSAHDNNTLYDKLWGSTSIKQRAQLLNMQTQANGIVLTSQGIPFLHAGVDIMRSKPKISGGFDSNSYESPDFTNSIKWSTKTKDENLACFNYYKELIKLRKEHPAFRMTNANDIKNNLTFIDTFSNELIAYVIKDNANNDSWENIIVAHNSASNWNTLNLPDGNWVIASSNNQNRKKTTIKGNITLLENETIILHTATKDNSKKSEGCNKGKANLVILPVSLLTLAAAVLIKKKH